MTVLDVAIKAPPWGEWIEDVSNEQAGLQMASPERWQQGGLVLSGLEGCGKSHRAHMWLREEAQRGHKTLHMSAHCWPLDSETVPQALVLEGVDEISEATGLLHVLKMAQAGKVRLCLTARTPPGQWAHIKPPDVLTRLKALSHAAIDLPSDAMIPHLLIKHFLARQLRPEMDVITYLSARIERSHKAIIDTVAALDRGALERRARITTALVRTLLSLD